MTLSVFDAPGERAGTVLGGQDDAHGAPLVFAPAPHVRPPGHPPESNSRPPNRSHRDADANDLVTLVVAEDTFLEFP